MEKITVYLTDAAGAILEVRAAVNGDTRTGTVNRALWVYDRVERIFDRGGWRGWLLRRVLRYQR